MTATVKKNSNPLESGRHPIFSHTILRGEKVLELVGVPTQEVAKNVPALLLLPGVEVGYSSNRKG